MIVDKTARALSNGLQDAELQKYAIDYASRSVQLVSSHRLAGLNRARLTVRPISS